MVALPNVGSDAGAWGTELNAFLSVAHNSDGTNHGHNGSTNWYNVMDPVYGAIGNGTADDTAAIQAAINAITGSATPATTNRAALGVLYIPAGTYKITSDLIIRSVQGFRLIGDGPDLTRIVPSGAGFVTAALLIDGSADGLFEGFQIRGDGTESLTDAIRLDWTTAAARSSSGNNLRDIRVGGNFVVGISLEGTGARQLDGTTMQNIVVTGGQTAGAWSTSGNWQKGVAFGNGTFGNIYDQRLYGVDVAACYYGYYCNASSFALYGAQPGANGVDFFVIPSAQTTISNIQSQSAGQFLIQTSSFSPEPVSISDVVWTTNHLDSSGNVMDIYGGLWTISNFVAANLQQGGSGAYVAGAINTRGAGASRPAIVTMSNITLYNSVTSGIVTTANEAQVVVSNYTNYNPNTATYAVTPLAYYTASGWVYPGSAPLAPDVQWFTTTGNSTWTKPSGAVTTHVFLAGAGSGAGSGRRGAAATIRCGGGGGGGGSVSQKQFSSADLASTVTVTIPTGGGGGAAITVDSTNGNAGSNASGPTYFGSYLAAASGSPGQGGTATSGTGGNGGTAGTTAGGAGATASTTGGVGGNAATSGGGVGGSSGGGITSADVAGNGALGNDSNLGVGTLGGAVASAAGVVDTTSPTSGTQSTIKGALGYAPGSGAASITTAAQAGAAATGIGAGGSGGGASLNGNNSGAGSQGGPGAALIITYFQ
jgi:pectate lyase-like protein